MNELGSIKKTKKVRYLQDVHFDFEGAHIALTSKGAASMKDEPYLLKSLEVEVKKESEESEELSEDNTGVTQQNEETKGTDMSDEALQKALDKIAELERINKSQTLKSEVLAGYGFEAEVEKGLVDLMVGLDDTTAITKALDALVAVKDEAITKAKAEVQPENEIAKALSEEQGAAEVESEEEVVKSLEEQVIEKLKAKQGAK